MSRETAAASQALRLCANMAPVASRQCRGWPMPSPRAVELASDALASVSLALALEPVTAERVWSLTRLALALSSAKWDLAAACAPGDYCQEAGRLVRAATGPCRAKGRCLLLSEAGEALVVAAPDDGTEASLRAVAEAMASAAAVDWALSDGDVGTVSGTGPALVAAVYGAALLAGADVMAMPATAPVSLVARMWRRLAADPRCSALFDRPGPKGGRC